MAQDDEDDDSELTKSKVVHVRVDLELWRRIRREVLRVDKKPSDWIRVALLAALEGPRQIEGLVRRSLICAFESPEAISAAVIAAREAAEARATQDAEAAELAAKKVDAERAAREASAKAERARRASMEAGEAADAASTALDKVAAELVKKTMESK